MANQSEEVNCISKILTRAVRITVAPCVHTRGVVVIIGAHGVGSAPTTRVVSVGACGVVSAHVHHGEGAGS